jgi:glycosyltransferase involved in cell wall biosynthesis
MRILSITAGAAGMYCGSCFRDNALAIELLARGHEVTLVPVYTPTRTDEDNVSRPDVLFGGISVYLQQRSPFFRRLPRLIDRLWDSPWVIGAFAGRGVSADARLLGDLTVSMLEGESGILKKEFDKLIDWIRGEPAPDVINLPNSLLISLAAPLKRALNRPVCITLQGEELFISGLTEPYRARAIEMIRKQTSEVDGFIAVSEFCHEFMQTFLRIPPDRIAVVPLGISMKGYERRVLPPDGGPRRGGPRPDFRVGYFARVAPEKGLHVLADAYVRFRQRIGSAPATLEVAGYMGPAHRSYLDEATAILTRAGLQGEMTYHGAVNREGKLQFLRDLDVLSVPATYDEPKGMFLLEAMAAGVPCVQPRRGAFIEVLEKTGGGVLVDPDNPEALANGLHALWSDRAYQARLADAAFNGVRAHYTIGRSATRQLDVYNDVVERASKGASC